jgi:hypothetical protein
MTPFLPHSLGSLPYLEPAETRSICAENPDGSRGGGARETKTEDTAARELGAGWKVRPCITLPAGERVNLAEIDGPGTIQHIWITVDPKAYRSCILRFYWAESDQPAVEVPLGDFFANGHGIVTAINSLPISVNSSNGLNSYWQMPFTKKCRVEIENQYWENIDGFFYQITYRLGDVGKNPMLFYAQWRRATTTRENPDYTIVDGLNGRGVYVGTYLAWTQLSDGWWGEGEIKFYIDGDERYPTICGTGTEDYVGGAWCFSSGTYSTPFLGYPLHNTEGDVPKHGLYRWHIMDPIHFAKALRVTIQALGWWNDGTYQPLADDIASVGYWYQNGPPGAFPEMPGPKQRLPR